MIKFFARGRCAQAMADNPVTTGSVGIPVQFSFSQEWDALQKIAVFRAGDAAVDVALTGDTTTVPADVLTTAGLPLMIGVYGAAADGTIVIPTVWAKAATIKAGTAPSGVDPSEPTPSWVAQVQQIAAEALETAEAVQTAAERGDFDGADGVSPTVTITSIEGGHRVTITDAAHPAGQSFDVLDGASGSGDLLVVPYDAATPGTVPDVTEIADGFDAGKAVIACASDLDGGGHVLPLTSLERSGGSVTALRFSAGGWTLTAGQVLGAWIWALSEDATTVDLVLTFSAAWDSGADAYVVTTTATLAQIDAALAAGQRIDARLTVDNDLLMRQGTVYAERTGSQLVLAQVNFLGSGVCYQLEGDTGGWYLTEIQLGGGGGAVDSVNGQTGTVVLAAADVGAGTYSKPSGGIPKTDLAAAVQTSLGKADTAYQKPSGGIPANDLASGVIPTVPTKTSDLNNDSGFVNAAGAAAAAPVQSVNGQTGAVSLAIPSSASDVGAVAANQGTANAGKFMVVGSDGVVAPVAMSAWQGGSY